MATTGSSKSPMYRPICKAKFCNSTTKNRKTHKFPSKPLLRKAWLDYCENNDPLQPNDFLCSRHFKSSDYRSLKRKNYLKIDAVPTVSLLEAAFTSKPGNGLENGLNGDFADNDNITSKKKILHMYDPENDQLGLLDQLDEPPASAQDYEAYDSEVSSMSEYSVRIKEEQELIVDETDENGYDEDETINGLYAETELHHEYFEKVEENYDERVQEPMVTTVKYEKDTTIVEEQTVADGVDNELLMEQDIDPEIDPATEKDMTNGHMEIDPSVRSRSPSPQKRSPNSKTPNRTPIISETSEKLTSPLLTNGASGQDKGKKGGEKTPENRRLIVDLGRRVTRNSEITSSSAQMLEDIEVEVPRRITRNAELLAAVTELPQLTNGLLEKGAVMKKPEPPKKAPTKHKETNHDSTLNMSQQQKSPAPLHNSTPLPRATDTTVQPMPPPAKKRKNRELFINPMCLANKRKSMPPSVDKSDQAKRQRLVDPPATAMSNTNSTIPATSKSLPVPRQRSTHNHSHCRAHRPAPPPPPPPFRIRDPILMDKELTSLQSHYKRLKDENSRMHCENERLFLVNSRLQSENGRLRASAILTNSKLKLENEKLRASIELYKAEHVREQNDADLAVEETEQLKCELEEVQKVCDDLREQLETAMTAANNASIAAGAGVAPSEIGDGESTIAEGSFSKKRGEKGFTNKTYVNAYKVCTMVGPAMYEKLRVLVGFPAKQTLFKKKRSNKAMFAGISDADEELEMDE